MAAVERRRHVVHPGGSIFLTETFVCTIVVVLAAVCLPFYLSGSWEGQPAAKAQETVIKAGQAFVKSTTTGSAQNMTPVPPTPYLKKLPDLSPYVLRALGYTKPFFIDLPLAIGRYILLGVYLPIAYLFHTLLAILSPVWVLLEVTVGIFVVAPFNALSWLAGLMFPVYVFCGVAALVGALLGLMGVGIGNAGLYLVSGEAADTGSSYGGARETTLSEREGRVREAPIQIGAQRSRNDTLATTVTLEGGSRRGKRVEFID